jgi:hypothetical protein
MGTTGMKLKPFCVEHNICDRYDLGYDEESRAGGGKMEIRKPSIPGSIPNASPETESHQSSESSSASKGGISSSPDSHEVGSASPKISWDTNNQFRSGSPVNQKIDGMSLESQELLVQKHKLESVPQTPEFLKMRGASATEVANVLHSQGKTGGEVAFALKEAGYSATEIAQALKDSYELEPETIGTMLSALGFGIKDIADAIISISDWYKAWDVLLGLGYGDEQIGETIGYPG